eukprot:6972631-Prymnesium_polylepis.1
MNRNELARKVAVEGMRLPPPRGAPRALLVIMARCFARANRCVRTARAQTHARNARAGTEHWAALAPRVAAPPPAA